MTEALSTAPSMTRVIETRALLQTVDLPMRGSAVTAERGMAAWNATRANATPDLPATAGRAHFSSRW